MPTSPLCEGLGEIRDGTADDSVLDASSGITSDDFSEAIRQAVRDKAIKAIVLGVDTPGGSVTASDQILHAVKTAQKAGKPVVVSMGGVAASGGYYISLSANQDRGRARHHHRLDRRARPASVSVNKTLGLLGANSETVVGGQEHADGSRRCSPTRRSNGQILNRQADAIYDDFTAKVAAGRKLPLDKVREAGRRAGYGPAPTPRRRAWWTIWEASGRRPARPRPWPRFLWTRWYSGSIPAVPVCWGGCRADGDVDASLGLMGQIGSILDSPALEAVLVGHFRPSPGSRAASSCGRHNLPRTVTDTSQAARPYRKETACSRAP